MKNQTDYNQIRAEVMRRAWVLFRKYVNNTMLKWSRALTNAWAEQKGRYLTSECILFA